MCQNMFLETFVLNSDTVAHWVAGAAHGVHQTEGEKRHPQKKAENRSHVKDFLGTLPNMPSHYCRVNTTKRYLEPTIQKERIVQAVPSVA